MSDLYWLTDERMERLRPFFPKSHARPRVDDQRIRSGIIFVKRNDLRWRDAPEDYEPAKTLYDRWKHWCEMGVFLQNDASFTSASRLQGRAEIEISHSDC